MSANEITPIEVKKRLDRGEQLPLIDVRKAAELTICSLPGALHIPMDEFTQRLDELEPYREKEIVIFCRSGGRSFSVCQFLLQKGFKRPLNMLGGVLAWSDEVDPSLPKY